MRRFKAQIAGNICSIARICNDEAVQFSPKMHVHEQIGGCLGRRAGNSVTHSQPTGRVGKAGERCRGLTALPPWRP